MKRPLRLPAVVLAYTFGFHEHNANATIRTSTRKRKYFDTCDCVYSCAYAYACVESVFILSVCNYRGPKARGTSTNSSEAWGTFDH